ncbi:hypothetical protein H2198_000855 [Neophaeococcomyces mojaviensis]|uniref:Uncharacterized protein n=1 Tax=Neophaeococcomyces mojaviensis TaxID=3383035 RepID=A0ACC3AJ54_9EURO|nr:hypothetical protein H2198_000855 [Knufia sp. JES_112]
MPDQAPNNGFVDEDDMHWMKVIMCGVLITGMFRRIVSLSIDQGRVQTHQEPNLIPPSARNIPFEVIYSSIEPPFSSSRSNDSASWFLTKHLPVMTSPDFLADGEWIGYYCHVRVGRQPTWDPMMHGINFEITADYADHCAVRSRGDDAYGPSSLFGTVHKQNGSLQITKQYENGTTWQWSAVMTPFGIVGSWGSSIWGGWFWLWKRSWSPA